ncbi:transcriptional regulator DeoR [Gluconobacter thailandicus F149-1 = NBRC 100600]|nr:DeoR/GlpR family DNA-binding transcription regulator [Gluconobacter thailandicus]AFW02409.1 DeoR family transcriptional regulator [Gluconobacter oxydans H24]ANQ42082.1 DeoR family transcriptional regulator [Gluconobacter oxydans]GAN90179.1 transcriptional regulator DeoR [Gluconobacter frateurii M-2]KXV52764.1 DeoR family transcriptional regulator [Gluconobacter thailandicus]GAN93207.1 transcriptional regulator DeoR [Gluconobacter thailandicus F149-1 = NBRC 100600]
MSQIRARLRSHGRVLAADLATEWHVPVDMIRRDLRELAEAGECRRVYGGALRLQPDASHIRTRMGENVVLKNALASQTAHLFKARQVTFIDTGSTNIALATSLPRDMPLTVVTSSPAVAVALNDASQIETIMIGGRLDGATGGVTGSVAVQSLQHYRFDLCSLGVWAISAEGPSVWDPEEAAFKREVLGRSERVVVMAEGSKIGSGGRFPVAPLDAVDTLIVAEDAPSDELSRMTASGVSILKVPVHD